MYKYKQGALVDYEIKNNDDGSSNANAKCNANDKTKCLK